MALSIRAKLFGGFGIVLVLLAIVGYLGWRNTTEFYADVRDLYNDRLLPFKYINDAQEGLFELRVGALQYRQASPEQRQAIKNDTQKWQQQIDDSIKAFSSHELTPDERDVLKTLNDAYSSYL